MMLDLVREWSRGRVQNGAGELIPTWQAGKEQPRPNDVLRFAEEGYSKNSLIYSCIREKATSFAPLQPQVERRDGTKIERHRVVELLERPNYWQDGAEFAETMATQFEAAGNVYIHKVRRSAHLDVMRERVGWPVQELQLIRPDYVTIEPGATKEQDVFLVTIGGVVQQRIPRADIIHIHEPNLINDFYGLSKIALIVREGSIDLEMSDFELAFYRNAGVPFGLLKLKGSVKPEGIKEAKSAFKRAFSGFRSWWDVLVLNQDEAEYQPLGTKPADMEQDTGRFHVESRICAVFGVPGVIVGARYALQGGGATFTYEDAEHAFWAETMVPFTMRFARAFSKNLLPEFATTRDRGARVTYDFTSVRALQEDRSRKLREVVRLVLTRAFTRDQALVAVGMQPLGGRDFYVGTGNQVISYVGADGEVEEPEPLQGDPSTENPDNPLEGAAHTVARPRAEDDAAAAVREAERALSVFDRRNGRH